MPQLTTCLALVPLYFYESPQEILIIANLHKDDFFDYSKFCGPWLISDSLFCTLVLSSDVTKHSACDISVDKAPCQSILAVLTCLKFPDKLENHFSRRIEVRKYNEKKEGKNITIMCDLCCISRKGVCFFMILRVKGQIFVQYSYYNFYVIHVF